jgi:hypothetical protein
MPGRKRLQFIGRCFGRLTVVAAARALGGESHGYVPVNAVRKRLCARTTYCAAGPRVADAYSGKRTLWFAKTLADFEINDIAALPPLFCYITPSTKYVTFINGQRTGRGVRENSSSPTWA